MLSQTDLVSMILKTIEKSGVTGISPRQLNAVIKAATAVIDELNRPDSVAAAGAGLAAWVASDKTGLSSRYMARSLQGFAGLSHVTVPTTQDWIRSPYPLDPDDLDRCVGLLDAVPELRPHIPRMADGHGPQWAVLAQHWNELEALLREEKPSGRAPKCYARMQQLLRAAV